MRLVCCKAACTSLAVSAGCAVTGTHRARLEPAAGAYATMPTPPLPAVCNGTGLAPVAACGGARDELDECMPPLARTPPFGGAGATWRLLLRVVAMGATLFASGLDTASRQATNSDWSRAALRCNERRLADAVAAGCGVMTRELWSVQRRCKRGLDARVEHGGVCSCGSGCTSKRKRERERRCAFQCMVGGGTGVVRGHISTCTSAGTRIAPCGWHASGTFGFLNKSRKRLQRGNDRIYSTQYIITAVGHRGSECVWSAQRRHPSLSTPGQPHHKHATIRMDATCTPTPDPTTAEYNAHARHHPHTRLFMDIPCTYVGVSV